MRTHITCICIIPRVRFGPPACPGAAAREKSCFRAASPLQICGINSAVMHRCRFRLYRPTVTKGTIPPSCQHESTFTHIHTHPNSPPVCAPPRTASARPYPTAFSHRNPHDKCAGVIESVYVHIHLPHWEPRHAIVSIELFAQHRCFSGRSPSQYSP